MTKERYATEEEKLASVPNVFPVDTSDNSHDNESKAGAQISKEVAKGSAADLSDEPADATEGHVEPRTEYDNGVNVPKEAKVEGRSQLDGKEPKNFRALNEDELSEGEKPKSSLTIKEADTKEEKDAVKEAAKAGTSFTKRSVSK